MIEAIGKELSLRKNYLTDEIDTIYFGGGTPSLLPSEHLRFLLNEINRTYRIKPNAEITLEANPEDISIAKAKELVEIGINRISLGVQSFDDEVLQQLNRVHSNEDALRAIHVLQNSGFKNLTIDLIYGIPSQSLNMWEANLAKATQLNIQHLSSYALTIEEKTTFGNWQKAGKFNPVADTKYEEDYNVMCSYLKTEGYEHYEVSNFAKPGFKSQHNSSYWQQDLYLGLGPGAHSYNKKSRQYNVSNNATYIKALKDDNVPADIEILSEKQIYNEYILTGLRTNKGIDMSLIKNEFGIKLLNKHKIFIDRCLADHLAVLKNDQLILTDKGLILADSIIIELMIDL